MKRNLAFLNALAGLVFLGATLGACGSEDERPSEVNSLRILAVRSDFPYAKPGQTVTASMLLHDGSPKAFDSSGVARPVRTLWLGGCDNPPGDLYYNCFERLHEQLASVSDAELAAAVDTDETRQARLAFGTSYPFSLPDDIITSRPQSKWTLYPYGIRILFYAACAGDLRVARTGDKKRDYPVECVRSGTDEPVGSADFEFGFYPIYAYDTLTNAPPVLEALSITLASSGAPCSSNGDCEASEHCSLSGTCIPEIASCTDDEGCKSVKVEPKLSPGSLERATSSQIGAERAAFETTWVSYYADFGAFEKDSRIIYDSGSGYTQDYSGEWTPSVEKGLRPPPREVRLYVVVRDNRGGVTWETRDVYVK